MTSLLEKLRINCYNDAQARAVQNHETVECQLSKTYEKLAGAEADVHLFSTLKKLEIATNDVMNFVMKQTIH